jgi:lysozyme
MAIDLQGLLGALNPAASEQKNAAQRQGWTQQQIEQARQIAAALNKNALNPSAIYSPWAGAARMADALVGGLTQNAANQAQRQNMASFIGAGQSPSVDPSGVQPQGYNDTQPSQGGQSYGSVVDAVKGFEGFSPTAYGDGKQISIGYGSKATSPNETIDPTMADARLRQELGGAAQQVSSRYPNLPMGWNQALTSLTYNVGNGWMNAGLGRAIANGDYDTARQIFPTYNHAVDKNGNMVEVPGLTSRRQAELSWVNNPLPNPGGNQTRVASANGNQAMSFAATPQPSNNPLANIPTNAPAQPRAPIAPTPLPRPAGAPQAPTAPVPQAPIAPTPNGAPGGNMSFASPALSGGPNAPTPFNAGGYAGAPRPMAYAPAQPAAPTPLGPQGSPQASQNGVPATPAAQTANAPVATPQGQGGQSLTAAPQPQAQNVPGSLLERGTFIDPSMLPRPVVGYNQQQLDFGLRHGMISPQDYAAGKAEILRANMPQEKPFSGGVVIYNPNNPSAQVYKPELKTRTIKDYGGKEIPQTYYLDSSGQMHISGGDTAQPGQGNQGTTQGATQGGLGGLYGYETTKAQAEADVKRANDLQSANQGAATVGAKLKRYADELDTIAANPNFNVGPTSEAVQWAKKVGTAIGVTDIESLTPNVLIKKVVNQLANEMTAAQSNEMKEAGSSTGRVFQTNVNNALGALPDDPSKMTPGAIKTIAQTMRQAGDVAINENSRTQQFFKQKGAAGVRDYGDYMQSFRDPKNPNYDHAYDMPSGFNAGNQSEASATPQSAPSAPISRVIDGKTYYQRNGKWFTE